MDSVVFSNNGPIHSDMPVCQVCFNHFDCDTHTPLVFPCGHTYCKKCIYKLEKNVMGIYEL
jgi:hypothetical protein